MGTKKMFKILAVVACAVLMMMAGCAEKTNKNVKTPNAATPSVGTGLAPALPRDEATIGTFTDLRDGRVYRTVKMPDGKTWMAENLNYKNEAWDKNDVGEDVEVEVMIEIIDKGSWCYENSADSCEKYGRLYTWHAALEACPAGWRLPDDDDWSILVNAVGGKDIAGTKLKSKISWILDDKNNTPIGTDDFGFSALPGGGHSYGGTFHYVGNYGYWWTTTEGGVDRAYGRGMSYSHEKAGSDWGYKSDAFSVRCVAD